MIFELPIEKELNVNGFVATQRETKTGIDMEKLIGVPHLFGRYFDTREGFMISPIGVMTLQPNGSVTGYSNPNEGKWEPYEFGRVSADKAFAFITTHNNWIPTSTWQQTYAGMPVGYFCDEPEAPHKLCLVPHTRTSNKLNIVYLVASCLHFYQQTVPKLLQQLYAEGITPDRIKVVVNASDNNEDKTIDGVEYAFTTHNAWEYSALHDAPLRWQFDYAMLIHDTVQVFPGFRRKVEDFNTYMHWDHLPATPLARCLLGLYSHNFLRQLNPWLRKIDGMNKRNAIISEVAGELLQRAKTALVIGDPEISGGVRQAEWKERVNMFNTATPRIRRVFPSINLHKFIHANLTDPESL